VSSPSHLRTETDPVSETLRFFSYLEFRTMDRGQKPNNLSYYFYPIFGLFVSLLVWVLIPYVRGFISFEIGLLFVCVVQI
jgi:hypothetical protein